HSDGVFRLSASAAAAVHYRPAAAAPSVASDEILRPAQAPARAPYARIATELRTPEQIFAALRSASRRRAPQRPIDAPRTALERDLVALWAELLNVESVGI